MVVRTKVNDDFARYFWAGGSIAGDGLSAPVADFPTHMTEGWGGLECNLPPKPIPAPLVAVILYAHEHRQTLAAAARSVLAQRWRNLVLILVDDASQDGSSRVIQDIARLDGRVVVIENPLHFGPSRSINHAMSQVFGTCYATHSGDCWMHPDHIAIAMQKLAANTELKGHYAHSLAINRSGQIVAEPDRDCSTGVFPRSTFDGIGGFDELLLDTYDEFYARLVSRFGEDALALSHHTTIVRGVPAVPAGSEEQESGARLARSDYEAAFQNWHRSTASAELRLDPAASERPFPAPAELLPCPVPVDRIDMFDDDASISASSSPDMPLIVRWPAEGRGGANWGDKLNPVLVHAMSGCDVINASDPDRRPAGAPVHFVIGSGLAAAREDAVVWGSGFISADQILQCPVERILAVRGPLSRQRVVAAGGDPMLPLGDPALLMPLLYNPAIDSRFDIGIISHFRDAGQDPLPGLPQGLSKRIIDITGGLAETIEAILSCRMLLSSSLHGLIIAHAYGRPGAWIKFSDRPLGDDFKFRDYWASLGRPDYAPHDVRSMPEIDPFGLIATPDTPLIDLRALIRACPFISAARKAQLLDRADALKDGDSIFAHDAGAR